MRVQESWGAIEVEVTLSEAASSEVLIARGLHGNLTAIQILETPPSGALLLD